MPFVAKCVEPFFFLLVQQYGVLVLQFSSIVSNPWHWSMQGYQKQMSMFEQGIVFPIQNYNKYNKERCNNSP